MNIIVTGFEKYADFSYNPSQLAVESLPDEITLAQDMEPISLTKLVFKSCCEDARDALGARLAALDDDPAAVILSGLAPTRDRINLERFALNIRDYRLADERGHQPAGERIDAAGPDAIRTDLPLRAMAQLLVGRGFLCEVSNHAGTFLCNEIYYRALRAAQLTGRRRASLFVHLPLPESYVTAMGRQSQQAGSSEHLQAATIKVFAAALEDIASISAAWLLKPDPIVAATLA